MRPFRHLLFFCFLLLGTGFLSTGCNTHSVVVHRPRRKIVRTWVRRNGCFVRRVIIPCYNARGNLKHQTVRCPNGRFRRRTWLHPDRRCHREQGFIP